MLNLRTRQSLNHVKSNWKEAGLKKEIIIVYTGSIYR